MTTPDLHELCVAYWSFYRARCSGDEQTAETLSWVSWVWDVVDAIGLDRSVPAPIDPVLMLEALAESAGDDSDALAFLGAGPVEDYIKSRRYNGERLEDAANRSDRLRQAIGFAR